MRITGNLTRVTELTLRLKSVDTKLKLFTEPFPYADRIDLMKPSSAFITFDDSIEIDQLIDALQKFKEQNKRYIGYWK